MLKNALNKYNLPDVPGVYLFKQGRKVLYVGKATSLRDRVRSYFDDDLIATRGPRIVDMVTKADRIAHEPTPTVLEALVHEAALIKKYKPIANSDGKDDSTFLYAIITKEDIPRVLVVRGKDIDFKKRIFNFQFSIFKIKAIYGPFPSGAQLREGLRLIRRIFPFFDTAKPVGAKSKHHHAHIEFNTQIRQYPRVFNAKEYRRTIRNVMLFLSGRGKELRRRLEREMRNAARDERFEDAAEARRELFALDHIQDVSLLKSEFRSPESGSPADRIEAYDTAHLSGTNAIGVMTVVVDGTPVKKEYRTFRIKGVIKPRRQGSGSRPKASGNDDIASLKEILTRRLNHPEWRYPKVIVIDGGKTQKNTAERVIKEADLNIPVIAVVKDEKHRPREILGLTVQIARATGISEADVVLANAEAHRFSLARHRLARSRKLRSK
jgi:excinuclease UvrABC nuclease subunit